MAAIMRSWNMSLWNAFYPNRYGILHMYAFGCRDLVEIHKFIRGSRKAMHAVVLIAIWSLWNNTIFNNQWISMDNIQEEIMLIGFLWIRNRSKSTGMNGTGLLTYCDCCFKCLIASISFVIGEVDGCGDSRKPARCGGGDGNNKCENVSQVVSKPWM
ncbi:hypothetical protein R6Q57_028369 [Mikania cordata]